MFYPFFFLLRRHLLLSKLLFIKILLMVRIFVVLSKAILTYLRRAPLNAAVPPSRALGCPCDAQSESHHAGPGDCVWATSGSSAVSRHHSHSFDSEHLFNLFITNVAKAASLFSHHVLSPISPIPFDLLCFHANIIVTVHFLREPAGLWLRWRILTFV